MAMSSENVQPPIRLPRSRHPETWAKYPIMLRRDQKARFASIMAEHGGTASECFDSIMEIYEQHKGAQP